MAPGWSPFPVHQKNPAEPGPEREPPRQSERSPAITRTAITRYAIGIGDLPAADDDARVLAAARQGGAESVFAAVEGGLQAQLGSLRSDARELSEGQWQKLALARACMREAPILVVLDEPTASLDAPSEHAIFHRHALLARRLAKLRGTVTVVVSHRFSTVRMADLILVLDAGRVVESGSHSDLMRQGGAYASLYRMQEAAYDLDHY